MNSEDAKVLRELIAAEEREKAAGYASGLLAFSPDNPEILGFLGGVLLELHRPGEAAGYLRRALAAAPDQIDTLYNLALALVALREFEEAAAFYRRILVQRPAHPEALNNLCHILGELEIFDENEVASVFRSAYRKFFARNPQFSIAFAPVSQLTEWCAANGFLVHELDPPGSVEVLDQKSGSTYAYATDGYRYAAIPGAVIIPGWDNVVAPTGHVLAGSGYQHIAFTARPMPHIYSGAQRRVAYACPDQIVDINADALFLSAPPDMQFGHWVMDFLPRLRAWRASGASIKLAAPVGLPQHHQDTLSFFGVRPDDILWCEFGVRYRFRTLVVAQVGDPYRPIPANVHFLYSALGPGAGASSTGQRRVFLSRSGTSRGRNIANREDFDALLESSGFDVIRRPETPVAEQNQILADASIVMTPFGTDMVAFLQLAPGTDLILLCFDDMKALDAGWGALAMASMCQMLGIRLHRFYCPATDNRRKSGYYRDMMVDCEALKTLLEAVAARRAESAKENPP